MPLIRETGQQNGDLQSGKEGGKGEELEKEEIRVEALKWENSGGQDDY